MTAPNSPVFQGQAKLAFKLRPWSLTDLDSLVTFANNPRISENLTNAFPYPYERKDGERFITMATSHDPMQIFAIEVEGRASGGIGIHPQADIMCKNMELGYWLAEPFWGNGIISAAIPFVIAYGFKHFDVTRIFARPFGTNIGSQRVLEKNGFKLEARLEETIYKNGQFLDELIML